MLLAVPDTILLVIVLIILLIVGLLIVAIGAFRAKQQEQREDLDEKPGITTPPKF